MYPIRFFIPCCFALLIAACAPVATPAPTQTPRYVVVTSTPTLTITPSPTKTKTPTPNVTATPTASATRKPTNTPVPTATVSRAYQPPKHASTFASKVAFPVSFASRSVSDADVLQAYNLVADWSAQLQFHDLNGDQVDDMIVALGGTKADIPVQVAVFIADGDGFKEAVRIAGESSKTFGLGDTTMTFEDWTGEGIDEAHIDMPLALGFEDTTYAGRFRLMVHCEGLTCKEVWRGLASLVQRDGYYGGLAVCQTLWTRTLDDQRRAAFTYLTASFSFYTTPTKQFVCPHGAMDTYDSDEFGQLVVFTKQRTTWAWTGQDFELMKTEDRGKGYVVGATGRPSAKSPEGADARLVIEYADYFFSYENGMVNDHCQLQIGGAPVGEKFTCKSDFANLEWRDVTGDGRTDLIVTVASDNGFSGVAHELLPNKNCTYQHIQIYQWDGSAGTRIANVAGCILQENLFGVRLEDVDGDNLPEILAAEKDSDNFGNAGINRVYKWDGGQFTLVGERPGP